MPVSEESGACKGDEQVRPAVPPNHPFAQRRSVSLADAAKEREEHDSLISVISAIEAGTGVGLTVLGFSFGSQVKLVRLTPEPKPFSFGIAARTKISDNLELLNRGSRR